MAATREHRYLLAPRRARLVGALACVLVLVAAGARAESFQLVSVATDRDGPAYVLRIEALFDAPPQDMLAVLTDYDNVHTLHPRITESRSLGRVGPATEEVYSRFEGCVLFFCRTVHRVERIHMEGSALFAEDVPGRGSFSEGRTVWRFSPESGGARLHYEARFVPDFPVAPLIGPVLLARSVERMTLETMAEAQERALLLDD